MNGSQVGFVDETSSSSSSSGVERCPRPENLGPAGSAYWENCVGAGNDPCDCRYLLTIGDTQGKNRCRRVMYYIKECETSECEDLGWGWQQVGEYVGYICSECEPRYYMLTWKFPDGRIIEEGPFDHWKGECDPGSGPIMLYLPEESARCYYENQNNHPPPLQGADGHRSTRRTCPVSGRHSVRN